MTDVSTEGGTRCPLQKVLLTDYSVTSQTALYYRARGQHQYDHASGRVCLNQNASLAFNTYFNSLNYYKWHKYTQVNRVFLELRLEGKFKIVLKSEKYGLDDAQTRVFYCDSATNREATDTFVNLDIQGATAAEYARRDFVFPFDGLESFPNLYFEIIALSENAVFHGGEYFCFDDAAPKPVRLALNICTRKQDEDAAKLLTLLGNALWRNEAAALSDKVRLYLVDNGGSLAPDAVPEHAGRCLPSRNLGEVGGFARGFLEIFKDRKEMLFTHVLTLEGDCLINAASLARLINFLALLKTEYAGAVISAATLDAGLRYRQVYSGALWRGSTIALRKTSLDLRNFSTIMKNEIIDKINTAPWAGACWPVQRLRGDALPLPLFTGLADVEFCLRVAAEVITLNGLCLWHPDSSGKEPPFFTYYLTRNTCIVTAARGQARPLKDLKRHLRHSMLEHLFRFSYAAGELMFDGIEDFCRGPVWLKEQNPEELHRRVQDKAPAPRPVEKHNFPFLHSRYEQDKKAPPETRFSTLVRKLTLNGRLLPPRRARILSVTETGLARFYRVRRVFFYNEDRQTGYDVAWNFTAARALIRRWFALKKLLDARYDTACVEYRNERDALRSNAFWQEYLKP